MNAQRWEKERSAWLLARSRPGTSRRRRSELLQRRAARAARLARTGVADSSRHEDITPPLFRRMLATDEGSGERLLRFIAVPLLFALAWFALWPAAMLAAGVYYLLWRSAPRLGRLWAWPWFAAGLLLLGVGAAVRELSGLGPGAWFVTWPPALHVHLPILVPTWLWVQAGLGLLLAGMLVRESGWAAVKPGSGVGKAGAKKNADGTFTKVADEDLVVLAPFAGHRSGPEERSGPGDGRDVPAAAPEHEDPPMPPDPSEDEPVFENEDGFIVFEDEGGTSR